MKRCMFLEVDHVEDDSSHLDMTDRKLVSAILLYNLHHFKHLCIRSNYWILCFSTLSVKT